MFNREEYLQKIKEKNPNTDPRLIALTPTELLKVWREPITQNYFTTLFNEWKPDPQKNILLFLPCTSVKPYSESNLYKTILEKLEKENIRNQIQIITISDLFACVPEQYERWYPITSYECPPMISGIIDKDLEFNQEDYSIMFGRLYLKIAQFLTKFNTNYPYKFSYTKGIYFQLINFASSHSKVYVKEILTTQRSNIIKGEEGQMYWSYNGLKDEQSLQYLINDIKQALVDREKSLTDVHETHLETHELLEGVSNSLPLQTDTTTKIEEPKGDNQNGI